MKKNKWISLWLDKGGLGKTEITCLISNFLAKKGYKVLVINGDPNESITKKILSSKTNVNDDFSDYLEQSLIAFKKDKKSRMNIEEVIIPSLIPNIDTIPLFRVSNEDFMNTINQISILKMEERQAFMRGLKEEINKYNYDFIFFDSSQLYSIFKQFISIIDEYITIVNIDKDSFEGIKDLFLEQLPILKEESNFLHNKIIVNRSPKKTNIRYKEFMEEYENLNANNFKIYRISEIEEIVKSHLTNEEKDTIFPNYYLNKEKLSSSEIKTKKNIEERLSDIFKIIKELTSA